MRFSLKSMLLIVAATAVTLFSFKFANAWIGDAYFTLSVALMLLGIAAAIGSQGQARAFWFAFSVVVFAYILLTIGFYGTTLSQLQALVLERQHAEKYRYNKAYLITSRAFTSVFLWFNGDINPSRFQPVDSNRFMSFMCIAHSSAAILFGWIAGATAARLYSRRVGV